MVGDLLTTDRNIKIEAMREHITNSQWLKPGPDQTADVVGLFALPGWIPR